MADKFCLFSTDISPVVDPYNADPAPATLVRFDQDPLFGNFRPGQKRGRGSVIETLGGVQVQDFGLVDGGDVIEISDMDALSPANVAQFQAANETRDGQFYLTDGHSVWRVQFSRNPPGFEYFRNLRAAYYSVDLFSYDMRFIVLEKVV